MSQLYTSVHLTYLCICIFGEILRDGSRHMLLTAVPREQVSTVWRQCVRNTERKLGDLKDQQLVLAFDLLNSLIKRVIPASNW